MRLRFCPGDKGTLGAKPIYNENEVIMSRILRVLAVLVIGGLALEACGEAPTALPTEAPTGRKVTITGFECPEPEPRMDVTSKELNLYVWTQYIPPEMQECFQLVYGITVNRAEYSSNEEMLPK